MSDNGKSSSDKCGEGGVVTCPWNSIATPAPHAQAFADIVRQQKQQSKCKIQPSPLKLLSRQKDLDLEEAIVKSLEMATSLAEEEKKSVSDQIPVDFLNFHGEEESRSECESDAVIAEMLQAQFDREYNDDLKRRERNYNKDAKVTICLDKYKRTFLRDTGETDVASAAGEAVDPSTATDWDRFETNERILDAIPRCGYMLDKEGEWMTKHDLNLNGVRNVCRLMSFPLEFATGDGAGFDMKLSNKVFNQLKVYSNKHQKKSSKMQDRKDNEATAVKAVDARTRLLLYKLLSNRMLEHIYGVISTGKEALILHSTIDPNELCAIRNDNNGTGAGTGTGGVLISSNLPTTWKSCNCALKIFKTTLNDFKQRDRYIKDDYRFKDRFKERFGRQNNAVIINMWAEKEWHNLIRIRNAGIRCPAVLWRKNHIIMMTMIGNGSIPAEKLKHIEMSSEEWNKAYDEVINIMHRLYNQAKLIHADLNEYNILWHEEHCWLIDVAQAVEPQHPNAFQFLMNDCNNIVNFFKRKGVTNAQNKETLFQIITGINVNNLSAAMLERLYTKGEHVMTGKEILTFPFDVAWTLSTENSKELSTAKVNKDESTASDTFETASSNI